MRFYPVVALLASAVLACTADRAARAEADADLTATELFTLEELPGAPLGEFSSLLRWRDGWVLADGTNRQIIVFDSVGRRLGSMGRPGGGPGEFKRLGPLALVNDTTVLALDLGLQRLSSWALPQRAMIGTERRINVPNVPGTLLVRHDGILVGDVWPKDLQSLELVDSVTLSPLRRAATAPGLYRNAPYAAAAFASVSVAPIGDSLLIGWQLVDSLQMLGPSLEPGRMIPLPVSRRRGSPPDLASRGKNIGDIPGMIPHTSLLYRLGQFTDGRIGVTHADLIREVDGNGRTRGGSREVWLTVLDRSGAPLCVDQRIAARTQDLVRPYFIRGELIVFRTSAEDGVTRVSRVELPEQCKGG
jgi:hypothetical protein